MQITLFFRFLFSKYLIASLLLIIMLFANTNKCAAIEALTVAPAVVGYLDSINLTENRFSTQGWIATNNSAQKVIALIIRFGDTIAYEGKFEKFERPDVALAMERKDWINSGWQIKADIPSSLKAAKYVVSAQAKMETGELVELPINKQASIIEIKDVQSNSGTQKVIWLALLGCALLIFIAFHFAEEGASKLAQLFEYTIHPVVIPIFALIFLFICLVGIGATGSSLEFGVKQFPLIRSDSVLVWGTPKPVRSDEWLVFTPLAISQANHNPAFPVINENLGEDGQNMLVIGMTGSPVHHISAFAKPATWGFYLFDLRRALSWYWWFPIFGCLFALWATFSLLAPNHWRIGFLVALLFCTSAYVTGWSYWPAYTVFFPSLMLYSSVAILRVRKNIFLLSWAILLGLSLAGFVLILYPPWQVSLGYLFLFIGIGIVLRDKLYRNVNLFCLLAFILALSLTILILWNWWLDTKSAIISMMNTVYPGRRDSVVGGSLTASYFLRGFTNLVTLYRIDGSYTNQSEIASFYYMFPSLFILFGVRLWEKKIGFIHCLLLLFLIFTVTFMLLGIPKELAKLTLWGRVTELRADLSLGLAYILLCGALLVPTKADVSYKTSVKFFSAIASLMWGGGVIRAMFKIPNETLSGFSEGIWVAMFLVILFSSWWLAIGEYRKFLLLNLMLSFATVLPFNPLMVAPNSVVSTLDFAKGHSRILVANTQIPAMLLLASGQPVSNGIFYYPQQTLWKRLDPDRTQENIYNRYQHLIFPLNPVAPPYYQIKSPQADVVSVMVDTIHFDFRKTDADMLVAPSNEIVNLKLNQSLKFVSDHEGWSEFIIQKQENK
jgi:hypothetical protein